MDNTEHKIVAPVGVENIAAEQDELENGLRVTAWDKYAWPDYITVEDRITGRFRCYEPGPAFDVKRYRKTIELLEDALATIKAWGELDDLPSERGR